MKLKIMAVTEVPLGRRTLRLGSQGNDVRELQQLLAASGFYFGSIDGAYGILTEEAVSLFQKTTNLRNDGIAGTQSITALKGISSKLNRIVYTVKPKESLKTVSQKLGVSVSAWRGIPGQGNPQRKIYPGMKLLLNQKVVFSSGKKAEGFPATASLESGWELAEDGELIRLNNKNSLEPYLALTTQPDTWRKVLSSHNDWKKLGVNLKRECGRRWGVDLRNAPLESIFRWKDLLHYLCETMTIKQIPFIILPMLGDGKTIQNKLYWLNLPQISNFARLLLIEPLAELNSPLKFIKSKTHFVRTLHRIVSYNLASKTLLMGCVGGWDWNLDQSNQYRQVSFKEARLFAAMNHLSTKYNPDTFDTMVGYMRRGERHCLIYRDQQGWRDWVRIGLKYNFLGFVIHNSKDLGRFASELIRDAFGVLPEDKV